jgi:Rho-type GTPase-activating protein 1/2
VHRDVLEFLVFHLKRVVGRERENLMTSMNVAVVFAPTIMRPESLAREMTDTQVKNEAVQFLVENCQAVFAGVSR